MQEASAFGNLIKISILVLNFSTESAEKPKNYDLLFLIAIYSPKNDNKHSSELRHYTMSEVFPSLGPILMIDLKY